MATSRPIRAGAGSAGPRHACLLRPDRAEARAQAREVGRDRRALVLRQGPDAGDVHLVHARPLARRRLVELAQQVFVMLPGKARSQRPQIALGQAAVATLAVTVVNDLPLLRRGAIP